VGGDYYDFLEMGEGRIGIALADIAGKGFPAALIMANLHATLRSRTAAELLDLPRQLESVNQLLFRFTETSRYATLFLGIYDDRERRLVYANCGHPPALLLRADDRVERLGCTAPALGLFEEWSCATGEVRLDQGDVAVIYSDGITEAWSDAGEEFGEQRLVELLRGQRRAGAPRLLDAVLRAVGEFSGREQEDDQTLVVARAL
jgi:serine phosphatase RsbU (regulator of sigma subunit)